MPLPVSFSYSRRVAARKAAICGVIVAVLTALCVMAGVAGLFTPAGSAAAIGVIVTVAGYGFFVPALRRLTRRDPVLILTERGVEVRDGVFASLGVILWRDVVAAREWTSRGGRARYLFFVREPDEYIDRIESPRVRAKVRKLGRNHFGSIAWVQPRNFDDPTALKQAVAQLVASSRGQWGYRQEPAAGSTVSRLGGGARPGRYGLRALPGRSRWFRSRWARLVGHREGRNTRWARLG